MIARLFWAARRAPWAAVGVTIAVALCGAVLLAPLDPFSQREIAQLRRASDAIGRICGDGSRAAAVAGADRLRSAFADHPDTRIPLRGAGLVASPREMVRGAREQLRRQLRDESPVCRTRVEAALRRLPVV
jgi:hypothetical protein